MIKNRINPALKIPACRQGRLAIATAITAFFALPKFNFFDQSNTTL